MTLKEIKKYYRVMKMDGYYNLSTLEVDRNSRTVYRYLCSIYKTSTQKFYVKGNEPVSKFKELQEQIDNYLDSLDYSSEYYCPSYRRGTAQDWFLYDLLDEYGFKRGGWREPSGFNLKRDGIYRSVHTSLNVDYIIDEDVEKVTIYLSTGNYSWVSTKATFDLKDIHKKLDGLLKPLLLTEGIQNITLSEKMKMSNVELTLMKLKGFDVSTSKVELKSKLLELANSL